MIHTRKYNVHIPNFFFFFSQVCQKKFRKKWNLKEHYDTHKINRKKYICDICDKNFVSKSGYEGHIKKQHN